MIAERPKDYFIIQSIVVTFLLALEIVFVIEFDSFLIISIVFAPLYIGTLSDIIARGRRFIIEEEGCTVCFWKYRKKYKWEELRTKRIEKHNIPSMFKGRSCYPYLEDVILSPKIIHKPKIMRAEGYSIFHPFTCIFLHFTPKTESKLIRYYEVDEEEFLYKMAQWGIELTVINP